MAGRVEESVWEERREWIRRQAESGLSVATFCRDNGLHEGNFYSWRRRFARLSDQSLTGSGKASGGRQTLQAFVQLPSPVAKAVVGSVSGWVEVSLSGGMVVRVPASNLAALETVLNGLSHLRQESRHA